MTLSLRSDTVSPKFKVHITLTRIRALQGRGGCVAMDDREWLMDRRFAGMNLGLQRIELLLQKMDNPQMGFPSIHVAGTNGKGTLCAFLSSAAANSGLKVGLFTTPHLVVIEERVRIDGGVIDSRTFDEHLSGVRAAAVELSLIHI